MQLRNELMNIPPLYDSFCVNPACIQNENTFFIYSPNNQHIQKKHSYRIIHPANFEYLFQNQQKEHDYNAIMSQIMQQYTVKTFTKIIQVITIKFIDPLIKILKQEQRKYWVDDCQEIHNLMKTGDHKTLLDIIRYEQGQKYLPFSHFSLKSGSNYKKIENQFQELTQKIIKILDQEIRTQPQHINSVPLKEKQLNKFNQTKFESFQPPSYHIPKTKLIKKRKKYSSSLEQNIKLEAEDFQSKENNVLTIDQQKWEIQQKSQEQILLLNCQNPLHTLDHIKAKYSDLRKIHIFSSTFAKRSIIKSLLKNYPNLEVFSLNCNHGLQSVDLSVFSKVQARKTKILELKWDLEDFFQYFGIKRYFPNEGILENERTKKIFIQIKTWQRFKRNEALLIESDLLTSRLSNYKKMQKKIKALHFTAVQDHFMLKIKSLNNLSFMKHLKVLHLKSASFQNGQKIFSEFIRRNLQIKAIVIDHCTYAPNSVDVCLSCLRILPNLKNLFFCSRNQYLLVDPNIFFECRELQCLYLNEIHLNTFGQKNNSGLSGIKRLKKLRHLGLVNIPEVETDIFYHLDQQIFGQLQLLNISATSVDRSFTMFLPKFRRLSYLSCDCLSIRGADYLKAFQQYQNIYGRPMALKSFSCEEPQAITYKKQNGGVGRQWNFSIDDMKKIASHLPNLEYLCVAKCQSLMGYNFEQFQSLRILNLTQDLDNALKEVNERVRRIVY